MDLFDYQAELSADKNSPLASKMRPKSLDDFIGQEHIVGKNKLLYRSIISDTLSSMILYGAPGTGKTTLAKIIANTTKSIFEQLNATTAGIKDIKDIIERAKHNLSGYGRKTILFIDEIHRFNKTQQDTLLPYVEDGTITLIGATTENPYFEVNKALISRSIIFELKPLTCENIKHIIKNALSCENGLGMYNAEITEDALEFLADMADGDARKALNAIEIAVKSSTKKDGKIIIDISTAQDCIQKRAVNYDHGDTHYDVASAFIKSMRGSDPDAAVYYLAKMLYSGEDPLFIARRVVICAAEDVGNADPQALQVAMAAADALRFIGMPEGRIILSQAVCYVASAPKSNASYLAVDKALSDVKNIKVSSVPPHLQDSHYSGAKNLGRGLNYKYAHDYENHYVHQQYLPDELIGTKYYEPTQMGYEKNIKEHLDFLRKH